MTPEIFRRCSACGASFRSGALFCPQCGLATSTSQAKTETQPAKDPVPETDGAATSVNPGMATLVDFETPAPDEPPAEDVENEQPPEETGLDEESLAQEDLDPDQTVPISASQTQRIPEAPAPLRPVVVATPAGGRRKRTGLQPGNIEGRIRPRVEKLRKGTSIVIDEASYDPSLRFVLIAGILFLLFIVLLILSKWIG